MRCWRRQWFWRSLCRRVGAGLTLLAYVITAFGLPLPADSAARTAGAAACGCTGDECGDAGCCCAKHGRAARPAQQAKSCCTGQPGCTMPCCRHDAPTERSPQDHPPAPSHDGESSDDDVPATGVRWVIGIAAMKCRGHSTLWVSAGVVLPPPVPCADSPALDPTGWLSWSSEISFTADLLPPIPPPRLATV